MNTFLSRLAPALALSLPLLAIAEQRADAAQAKGSATPLRYQSAFADYKPWQDVQPGNWRRLNDGLVPAAGRAGGHTTHGMGDAPPAPAAKASAPAAPPHQSLQLHPMQGDRK
ncbi:MAG: hypothetical protein WAQ05_00485 [Rubrivivax sp.]